MISLLLFIFIIHSTHGQHSVANDDTAVGMIHAMNPFYRRTALNASQIDDIVGVDAASSAQTGCPASAAFDLQLAWTTKLGASVYSSPLLVPSSAAGGPAVWSNTFVRYAEAVDGHGHELPGWPYAFSQSTFHTSPLAYDIDADGVDEMLLLTFDAEAVYLSQSGLPLRGRGFKLPKLKVRKDWFAGLHDIHTTPFKRDPRKDEGFVHHDDDHDPNEDEDEEGDDNGGGAGAAGGDDAFGGDIGAHGGLSPEAEASFSLFASMEGDDEISRYEEGIGDGDFVQEAIHGGEPRLAKWAVTYEDEDVLTSLDKQGYLYVDAHALSTPTLADIDNDGQLDLIVALSYFLEEEATAKLARIGIIVDKDDYVAGGVLAVDPIKGTVKWSVHLDLTTEKTKLRAYIYSPVTVVDLDGDGELEVIVGTSMGFLYVLHGKTGKLRDGFPVQLNEIQAQVVTADVDSDGTLELIAADAVGSVAAWRHDGTPLWEVQTSGLCTQGVTLTSALRNDGSVQIIVPTVAGVVHLLEGRTGAEIEPFPLRTEGRILSAVLVINLALKPPSQATSHAASAAPSATGASFDGLASGGGDAEPHLVFASFDGHVYVVHARTGCFAKVDIGEHAYTMVLADDLTGNGRMDLLLSTMNGNLYCFETQTPYNPLRSWRSQNQGRNVWQQREGFMGVVIEGAGGRHTPRRIAGAYFDLEFTIHDSRSAPSSRWYRVEARLGRKLVLHNHTYHVSGSRWLAQTTRYRETLKCPDERTEGVLTLSMVNEHGQYFEDMIAVNFNAGFEVVLKWVTLLPFAATIAAAGLASREAKEALLGI